MFRNKSTFFESLCSFKYGLLRGINDAARIFLPHLFVCAATKKFLVKTCVGLLSI